MKNASKLPIELHCTKILERARVLPKTLDDGTLRLEFFRIKQGRQMRLKVVVSEISCELKLEIEATTGNCYSHWSSNRYTLDEGQHILFLPLPKCHLIHLDIRAEVVGDQNSVLHPIEFRDLSFLQDA